ncbi:MAG: fibronectin type III domain-containing protein [Acidobacteriota bacterium]
MPVNHRSKRALPWLATVLVGLWSAASAPATVIVPISDAELADRSPLIVEGQILAVEPAPGAQLATDYLVQIEHLIKGSVPAVNLIVRLPGGIGSDGVGLHLWGVPKYREGEAALFFLQARSDGTFTPHDLLLGAFYLSGDATSRVAHRDLKSVHQITLPGRPTPADGVRDLVTFRRWLKDHSNGHKRQPDYFLPQATPPKFTTPVSSTEPPPTGCGATGGHSPRWFNFDQGGSIPWRSHLAGQDGLEQGGVPQLLEAIDAWNRDPNTPIAYTYSGLTPAATGLGMSDGLNVVLFNDLNGEIPGTFDGSGLLALSGPRFSCELQEYSGELFHPIFEADVLTQDGIELLFAALPYPDRLAEQLFAHELGHTLGLAHSTDPEALMNAELHLDQRGAALDTDDLAGALYLYGPRDLTPPAAPTDLTVIAEGPRPRLDWTDASDNESVFRIERRQAQTFTLLTTVPADSTTFLDTSAEASTSYTYRVRAQNGVGNSDYSAEVEIETPEDQRPEAPTNLRVAPLSSTTARLTWQDNATDEDGFVIEILLASGWIDLLSTLPADTTKAEITGLTAGTKFSFRVRAFSLFGDSATSNAATTATFADDLDCVVTSNELCLLGGRFKVSVQFRDQIADGPQTSAVAVPSTDQSGLFWFFGPENVELGVKALDGRGFNNSIWFFYGALTNLEYWVHVTDTDTGEHAIYYNPPGEVCGLADTNAFPEEPAIPEPAIFGTGVSTWPTEQTEATGPRAVAARLAAERRFGPAETLQPTVVAVRSSTTGIAPNPTTGDCTPGPETLCLLDGRMSVEVAWRTLYGNQGNGRAIIDTDNSGFFYFFNIENFELVVKVLDGSSFNDYLWWFHGALTDVEYWITVTDTSNGASRVYYNPPGEVCGQADIEAFVAQPTAPPPPPPGPPPGPTGGTPPPIPPIPD